MHYAEEERKRIEADARVSCSATQQTPQVQPPKLAFIIKIVDDDAEADITGDQLAAILKHCRKESFVYLPAS